MEVSGPASSTRPAKTSKLSVTTPQVVLASALYQPTVLTVMMPLVSPVDQSSPSPDQMASRLRLAPPQSTVSPGSSRVGKGSMMKVWELESATPLPQPYMVAVQEPGAV